MYSSVIEAVDSFSSSSESTLVPAVDSASRGRKFSQDSSDIDIDTPPNYTAAATFPVSRDLVIHACMEMI